MIEFIQTLIANEDWPTLLGVGLLGCMGSIVIVVMAGAIYLTYKDEKGD